jgi:hypothetical protein
MTKSVARGDSSALDCTYDTSRLLHRSGSTEGKHRFLFPTGTSQYRALTVYTTAKAIQIKRETNWLNNPEIFVNTSARTEVTGHQMKCNLRSETPAVATQRRAALKGSIPQ